MFFHIRWRKMRRAAHDHFVGRAAATFEPVQERESAILLSHMLRDPGDWDNHLMRYDFLPFLSSIAPPDTEPRHLRSAASAVLSSVYGRDPLGPEADSMVARINDITHRLGGAIPSLPGASLVQFFPFMRYLPEWMAEWKRKGVEWCKQDTDLLETFLDGVRKTLVRTSTTGTFIKFDAYM